jgi:hypothetical protein
MARSVVAGASAAGARPEARRANVKLLTGRDHYEELVSRELPRARVALWISTANLKDLHVEAPIGSRARARGRMTSLLEQLGELADAGVDVRILHGRPPSKPFAKRFSARTRGRARIHLRECPRVHMKVVVVDGRVLYLGSANFTGAGLGARAEGRRNFEIGILTDDEYLLDAVQGEFEGVWSGKQCAGCRLRSLCPRPLDQL